MNDVLKLDSVEIEPKGPAKRSVIWLHGLGADGNDFVPIVPQLKLPDSLGVRFIFPHAPIMPVTLNSGFEMRAWFDIISLSMDAKIDLEGIARSIEAVRMLIANEMALGILEEDIVLAGFSQGAVLALLTGLCHKERLAGIIALSGFLILTDDLLKRTTDANRQIPIFMGHGLTDPLIPYLMGQATYHHLQQVGYPVSWHTYPMAHSVCAEEINDISQWLQTIWAK